MRLFFTQIGNWSRWLTDMFGIDADDSLKEDQHGSEDDDGRGGDSEPKSFLLLNDLSDLLMLPKDMLMDRTIRQEVYLSINVEIVLLSYSILCSISFKLIKLCGLMFSRCAHQLVFH